MTDPSVPAGRREGRIGAGRWAGGVCRSEESQEESKGEVGEIMGSGWCAEDRFHDLRVGHLREVCLP